ncbi:MAG: MobA/MobL family protein [Pseudomonadota bacterium]|nr:MobA/MobL family protein [Pseudomonadota bacterium]
MSVVSRGRGQSAVAAAAYRTGTALRDERYAVTHNYAGKRGILHSELVAPAGAPAWARDRQSLWNRVEACERRKDSQLARLIEVGLPAELSTAQCVTLLRDYLRGFIDKGMIADFAIRGNGSNPHAHILLTLRSLTAAGFGSKERHWNGKALLVAWRTAWAGAVNQHLANAGHAVRIDHRTLDAQQIELEPHRRIGMRRNRPGAAPAHLTERLEERQRIAEQNGAVICEDPTVALRALTHQRPTFTSADLEKFLQSRTGSAEQCRAAVRAVLDSPEIVPLAHGRLTSRDMLEAENSLVRRTRAMCDRRGNGVSAERRRAVLALYPLQETERQIFDYLVGEGDAKALVLADAQKAAILEAAHHAWASQGMTVIVAGQSAAQAGSGPGTVLLMDECQLIPLKELEGAIAAVDKARGKTALIVDADRLNAMKVESAFHSVLRHAGSPVSFSPPTSPPVSIG